MLSRYLKDESGQALSEYGLLIAVIGVAIVGLLVAFRKEIGDAFTNATKELHTANNPT